MVKIHKFTEEINSDDKKHGVAEISVGSSSELVNEFENYVFEDGSIAWDITNGDIYGLTGGSWVKQ